jgi:hypothetical protein
MHWSIPESLIYTPFLSQNPSNEKTFPIYSFPVSDPQAQIPNKRLPFLSNYDDVSMVPLHTWVQCTKFLKNIT